MKNKYFKLVQDILQKQLLDKQTPIKLKDVDRGDFFKQVQDIIKSKRKKKS